MRHLDRNGQPWCGEPGGERVSEPSQCGCIPCMWAVLQLAEAARARLVEMRDNVKHG